MTLSQRIAERERGHDRNGDFHCYTGAQCVTATGCHRSHADAEWCNRRAYGPPWLARLQARDATGRILSR